MTLTDPDRKMIIAGPCAAETREQVLSSLQQAAKRNATGTTIDFVRVSLWKPRTKPGFDGLKEEGIPLLAEAAEMGLNPATEVLVPEHAKKILRDVLPVLGNGQLMLWIGARNQNHYIQQEIARVASIDPRVKLMVKNQPWHSESHWEGIVDHVLAGGMDARNVVLCHRGFVAQDGGKNPLGLRNVPDSEMAMRIRRKSGMTMVLDLSHTAGHVDKVAAMAHEAAQYRYDGVVVEVHPTPRFAWTDAKQQLTWEQFDDVLDIVKPVASSQHPQVVHA